MTVFGVFIFTLLDDIYHFSIILCINAFVQAGLWPSLSKLIYEMYSPAQFCLAFACLGISSRLGSAYSKAIIGYLLYLEFNWRSAIRIIACLGLFGLSWFILWIYFYLKSSDRVSFAYPQYNQIKHVLKKGDHSQQERVKSEVSRQLEVDPQQIDNNNDNNFNTAPHLEESHNIYQSPSYENNINSLRHEVR